MKTTDFGRMTLYSKRRLDQNSGSGIDVTLEPYEVSK